MEANAMRTFLIVVLSALGGILLFAFGVPLLLSITATSTGSYTEPSLPEVQVPPRLVEGYLGSQAQYRSDNEGSLGAVLAAGSASISGKVLASGKPVAGLRLRLPLNGAVWSQWAATDANGGYRIPVPPGEYRVDGFELDPTSSDQLLSGLTMSPDCDTDDIGILVLSDGASAEGPHFEFVPVIRIVTRNLEIAPGEPAIVEWESYPGATQYRVGVMERRTGQRTGPIGFLTDPGGITVNSNSLDLNAIGPALKAGYSYSVSIDALDADGRGVSTTPMHSGITDVRVRR